MKQLIICSLILFSANLFALSETNYQTEYNEKVLPLIHQMDEGYFVGANNVRIHYRRLLNSQADKCLLIIPGRTEPIEKYAEVIYDLLQTETGKRLNFLMMDPRGQGQSDRMAAPSDMGHVDEFKNYVSDLETFIDKTQMARMCPEKRFLLAHSMGAGIATAFLLKHPEFFNHVIMTSPMLKIQTKPYPYGVARAIVSAQVLAKRGNKFASGQKGFNGNLKFEDNLFTTSPARFKMTMDLFNMFPKTQLGGVSNRWILEVMKATNKLRCHYHEVSVPMHVYIAGNESYSEPKEMAKFCHEAANCKSTFLPNSKHEVLMDRDVNRDQVMNDLVTFFQ